MLLIFVLMSCVSPKALEYKSVKNLSVNKINWKTTSLSMDLEYYNPNPFGLKLRSSDLDIFIGDHLLGHSNTDTLVTIPKKGTFLLPIRLDVKMENLLRNSLAAFSGKEITIRLQGKVKAGKGNMFLSFPVNYESKQKFTFF